MLASLVVEQGREPLTWAGMPVLVQNWLVVAGAFAAFSLLIWLLAYILRSVGGARQTGYRPSATWLAVTLFGGTLLAVGAAALPRLWARMGWLFPSASTPTNTVPHQNMLASMSPTLSMLILALAGMALIGVTAPVFYEARKLRWRRIWALARLSMKEAIRSKILWAFSFLVLVFLFGSWFITSKPDQQVQTYVETVYTVMMILLVLTAGLLASLSIPADLRRQTIHTIITKPVERFEIVLGRFIGYSALMGAVLAVMTFFSLIYVWRGVDPDAKRESLRARVPVFGQLHVVGDRSVGREWGYRKYIGMLPQLKGDAKAVWDFYNVPASLANQPDGKVRMEYGFDIFRTYKGKEGVPVIASFTFETSRSTPESIAKYKEELDRLHRTYGGRVPLNIANELAEKYGYYSLGDAEVVDFHTIAKDIPSGLFKDLQATANKPALSVTVRCQSSQQFLGMAQPDMYFLQSDGSNNLAVAWNFYKGAAGIGMLLCLVVGVAVTCSTYLNGIISFLLTFSLLLAGLAGPFIKELADRQNPGGGPVESAMRLANGTSISAPLENSAASVTAKFIDAGVSDGLQGFLYMLPGVKHLSLTDYVARGFDISAEKFWVDSCLPLIGYLFLWVLSAFYLMKSREIAA